MEENMELVELKNELENMSTEDREAMAAGISAVIAGVLHSFDRDKMMDNIAKELEKIVGDELDKKELEDAFGDEFVTDVVDAFTTITGDNVRQLIGEIGIDVFADVGYRLENIMEPTKITDGEE